MNSFEFELNKMGIDRSEKSNIEKLIRLELKSDLRLGEWVSVSVLPCVSGVKLLPARHRSGSCFQM